MQPVHGGILPNHRQYRQDKLAEERKEEKKGRRQKTPWRLRQAFKRRGGALVEVEGGKGRHWCVMGSFRAACILTVTRLAIYYSGKWVESAAAARCQSNPRAILPIPAGG